MIQHSRRAMAIAIGAVVLAGTAACAAQPATPDVATLKSNALSYQIAGNWNPVTSSYLNLYFPPQQAVYEPLIRLNSATFEYEPVLAEGFTLSDDLRSMDVTLREDIDFTDGTHLDADAVKTVIDSIRDGEAGYFVPFFDISALEVEVLGEYELRLISDVSIGTDYFMHNLSIVPIVSPTALADDPEGLESLPVGTGPYVLDEQVADVSVRFVRNPDYRDPEAYEFDEVEFLVFADSIAASNALKSGQINVASLDPTLATDAEANGFVIQSGGGFNYMLSWRDTAGAIVPELADPRVRQAIAYSLDRESITATINSGYGSVNTQAWSAGSPYYLEGADDRYAYDLERAKELMAEAGYASGFSMSMGTTGIFAAYEPVLLQSFADIGITLTFDRFADLPALNEGVSNYAMDIYQWGDVYTDILTRTYPQLADQYAIVDSGTADEVAAALQAIATEVLDDALAISVARPLDTWATVPEITVDVGIVSGWPPILENFRRAD